MKRQLQHLNNYASQCRVSPKFRKQQIQKKNPKLQNEKSKLTEDNSELTLFDCMTKDEASILKGNRDDSNCKHLFTCRGTYTFTFQGTF